MRPGRASLWGRYATISGSRSRSIGVASLVSSLRGRRGIVPRLGLHCLGLLNRRSRIEVSDDLQGVQGLLAELETLAVGLADVQLNEVYG